MEPAGIRVARNVNTPVSVVSSASSSKSNLALVAVLGLALLAPGCSSQVLGEGAGPPNGPSAPEGEGNGTSSGVPAEVEALFAPPADDTVTAGKLTGVWANDESGTQTRLAITKNSVTVAKRCSSDGRITHVTAQVRADDTTITILESKSAAPDQYSPCYLTITLEVAEWRACDDTGYDGDCFKIEGTKLTGLHTSFSSAYTTWIKLSD